MSSLDDYSYLESLPNEVLLEIFYQREDVSSLCKVSKRFNELCKSDLFRKEIYYTELSELLQYELIDSFYSLTEDETRNQGPNTSITPKQLERLTWMVEFAPWLVKSIQPVKRSMDPKESPLYVTRNTEIYDLLLRYGAKPGIRRHGLLDRDSVVNTNIPLLWQLIGYGLKLFADLAPLDRRLADLAPLDRRLADLAPLDRRLADLAPLDRRLANQTLTGVEFVYTLKPLAYPGAFDFLLSLIEKGLYSPLSVVQDDTLIYHPRRVTYSSAILRVYQKNKGYEYSSYLMALTYLNLGIKPQDKVGPDSDSFLSLFDHPDELLPTYRALCCFLDLPIETLEVEENSDEGIYDYRQSLEDVERQADLLRSKRGSDLSSLDYPHLKQLYIKAPYPEWDDRSFWIRKLETDFPGEFDPSSLYNQSQISLSAQRASADELSAQRASADELREQYLKLYLAPRITYYLPSLEQSGYITMDYHTGRGWMVCANYLLGNYRSDYLEYRSLRLTGQELLKPNINALYCYFPLDQGKELAVIQDPNTLEIKRIIFPNLVCPYAMRLISLDGNTAYVLQFTDLRFFAGYLLLCSILGLDSRKHCPDRWRVKSG